MPSVTVISNPGTYSPAEGRLWYVLNSLSSGAADFKYTFSPKRIDLLTGATTSLGTFPVPPAAINQPTPGYGRFSVDEALSAQLTYNITPFIQVPMWASQSIAKYYLNYGWSYNPNGRFVNITNVVQTTLGFNNITSGGPFDFAVGDIITIVLDDDSIGGQYNGLATVNYVQNPLGFQYISIDKPFVAPGAGGGVVTQIKRLIGGTSSTLYAYNGTRQYWQNDFSFTNGGVTASTSFDWSINGPGYVFYTNRQATSALTNYKDGFTVSNFPPTQAEFTARTKKVLLTNYETLSLLFDDAGSWLFTFNTYNSDRVVIGTYSNTIGALAAPSFLYKRYDMPVGPKNLINAGWITNWTNVAYYTFKLYWTTGDEPPFTIHNKYMKYYEVDRRCATRFTNYRLAFVNLHGGVDYWNFNYKSKSKMNVDRNEYTRGLNYNYSIGDRGDSIYSIKSNVKYNVTSDFLDPYDHAFLGELIRTTEAYIVDENNKLSYPIIVTTNDWDDDYDTNDNLRIAEVEFRLAFDGSNQTG